MIWIKIFFFDFFVTIKKYVTLQNIVLFFTICFLIIRHSFYITKKISIYNKILDVSIERDKNIAEGTKINSNLDFKINLDANSGVDLNFGSNLNSDVFFDLQNVVFLFILSLFLTCIFGFVLYIFNYLLKKLCLSVDNSSFTKLNIIIQNKVENNSFILFLFINLFFEIMKGIINRVVENITKIMLIELENSVKYKNWVLNQQVKESLSNINNVVNDVDPVIGYLFFVGSVVLTLFLINRSNDTPILTTGWFEKFAKFFSIPKKKTPRLLKEDLKSDFINKDFYFCKDIKINAEKNYTLYQRESIFGGTINEIHNTFKAYGLERYIKFIRDDFYFDKLSLLEFLEMIMWDEKFVTRAFSGEADELIRLFIEHNQHYINGKPVSHMFPIMYLFERWYRSGLIKKVE